MHRRKKHNKLVRDKIPAYIRRKGSIPIVRIADEAEYWQKLKEKLAEEVKEFVKDETIEELADILEVVDALADYKGFTKKDIASFKKQKVQYRGAFTKRIILIES